MRHIYRYDSMPVTNKFDRASWLADSACRKYPTDWWFSAGHEDMKRGKHICATCPVRVECLEHAVARPGLLGMWAETTPGERAAMRARPLVASVPS